MSKRQTGRTTRMMQDANYWASTGARVIVVGANANQLDLLRNHTTGHYPIVFHTIHKWKDYLITGQYPVGHNPSDVVLFDHYAIEAAFPDIIREYELYDQ